MNTSTNAPNTQQTTAWDGDEGEHWTQHQEHYDAAARRYNSHLLGAAHISAGEAVLDIGCGCGASTREAARRAVWGAVLGVDLSGRMIARARELSRAEGIDNTRFEQADAQVHRFDSEAFDVAVSRFGAMFFDDPVAAFTNIGRALRPGARLALLSWQELVKNRWVLALREALTAGRTLPQPPTGTPGPFGLAESGAVRRILADAGFDEIAFDDVKEPLELGSNGADAFTFVRGMGMTRGLLDGLDESTTTRALEQLRTVLNAHDTGSGVLLDSCALLVTARRR